LKIIRVPTNSLNKSAQVATRQNQLPAEWALSTYAPGLPIQPFISPSETEAPREIDYPISVNASLQPRTGYGLMAFSDLKVIYETITEVRMPIGMSLRQLTGFTPHLVDLDGNELEKGHPYEWLTVSPDRTMPFDVWLTRFMKSSDIFDAGAFSIERDGDDVTALHYLDGSTLFIIIDEKGRVPKPHSFDPQVVYSDQYVKKVIEYEKKHPGKLEKRLFKADNGSSQLLTPAFAQVIKGTPFAWYTSDEIWYKPRSTRYDAPYGETFIEQALPWIMILANIAGFELAHYREGNMPEGWFESPEGWTLDRIAAFELANNARMSSGPAERMRGRFYPAGMKWHETKKAEFPKTLYERAFNNLVMTFGYPPSEFGQMSGAGLGGKDLGNILQDKAFRDAIIPRKSFVEDAFNNILETVGVDDARFELGLPTRSLDPEKEKQGIYDGVAHGIFTLNDALGRLGEDPVEGSMSEDGEGKKNVPIPEHIANKHLIIAGSEIYVMEDLIVQGGLAQPAVSRPGAENPGGADAALPLLPKPGEPQGEKEFAAQREKAKQLLADGKLPGKTYSIPSLNIESAPGTEVSKIQYYNKDHELIKEEDVALGTFSLYPPETETISIVEKELGAQAGFAGINLEGQDRAEFDAGMKEEQEHAATVGGDQKVIAQIVMDHLREDPHYYTHLAQTHEEVSKNVIKLDRAELQKHCGLCDEDDAYFGAPVAREYEFTFPINHHANDVEIVAMTPDGLPPKPALWKPEGGELEALRQRIGGPMYVREEAAYLLDRSLGFNLVPLAYVAESHGERGAVIYYTGGATTPKPLTAYSPEWMERAAVLDYIMSQQDRGELHNYLTHPDDPARPVLIDNGLTFPVDQEIYCESPFCQVMLGRPLSEPTLQAISVLQGDEATWKDIKALIGDPAVDKARACAQRLLDEKAITPYHHEENNDEQSSEQASGDSAAPAVP